MNEELREAIEVLNGIERAMDHGRLHDPNDYKAFETLRSLATAYLSINGMPENRLHWVAGRDVYSATKAEGFDESLYLCRLAFLKKMEGLEGVIQGVVDSKAENEDEGVVAKNDPDLLKLYKDIATAIRTYLLEGEG